MKILIHSTRFSPSVGGIESMMLMLAREFVSAGHEVTVLTETDAASEEPLEFEVIRRGGIRRILQEVRRCDVFFGACISLKTIWAPLLLRRPTVISHHTWYQRSDGRRGIRDLIKLLLTRMVKNIAVSQAISNSLWASAEVIGNCWDERVFRRYEDEGRESAIVFVGRLVSDKGADLLIQALSDLHMRGMKIPLTIVGNGPEAAHLRSLARVHQLGESVQFIGELRGEQLARTLNRHRIMAIPSRWKEPFGIVALEGLSCGCYVIASEGGGLNEAVGRCGLTFPNGDRSALADRLFRAVLAEAAPSDEEIQQHLARFRPSHVSAEYLKVIEEAIK